MTTNLLNLPVDDITEEWAWRTDVQVATDGTELRVELYELPKRRFTINFGFDDIDELRNFVAVAAKVGSPFNVVLFQYATKLTAAAAITATALLFTAARTDLREGATAYLYDNTGGEIVTIDALSGTGATLHAGISRAYGKDAKIAPIVSTYSSGALALNRNNPDYAGDASTEFRETGFNDPFVHSYNTATLTTLGAYPILERNATGTDFASAFDSGIDVIDYGGVVSLRNQWKHSKEVFARDFLCQRVLNPADWDYWRVFADYAKGSCNPFLLPTYRQDFTLKTFDTGARSTIPIEGSLYRTDYFPWNTYKQVAIKTAAGMHYATVTAATASGDDTNLTISPAVPDGTDWDNLQSLSLLLLCRIADDRVSCDHAPLHTLVSLQLRTVDE